MAQVTNLKERVHPGKVVLARQMQGNGAPTSDTRLADDTDYPVGSEYVDLDTNYNYRKTANYGWQREDVAS